MYCKRYGKRGCHVRSWAMDELHLVVHTVQYLTHDRFEEGTEPRVCDLRSPTKLQKQLHQWLITYDSYVKGLEPWGPQPSLHDMMKYNPRYDLLGWNKKKALVVTEMGLPLHISLPAV